MKSGIVVVGSLNMDLVVNTSRHPKVGETVMGSEFNTFPGGKGANQAVAAARLGGNVRMIGRVGRDDFGQALLQTANVDGIDTTFIRLDDGQPSGVALITVDQAGQNTIVVVPGANGRVNPDDVSSSTGAFEDASLLLVQLEVPLPAILKAMMLAKERGMQVILNPAPAQPLDAEFLGYVDTLVPNQTELALLTGTEDLLAGVEKLHQWEIENVIVTLGGEGVLVSTPGKQLHLPAYPVKVVDTVAAGDAFLGALAVALTQGLPFEAAARWGNAAGALSVTRPGAQPSLPTRAELDDFLKRYA